ncbi:sugar ABC transporter substrate-binding protein [Halolactibacillus miurensis]|uniref:N-acetylglucosamine transport system substrate-binding protein n=1 Tax=Halolactibacillus miurensis TaxID=306541 RepID=A0A1I6P4B6_9BACI|nr:carbohydrate ABC transporter substrate-binding protein [Halolactibacillus miurensis]GEM03128.1 sugar ABC transporter substrate-binding protein [Halolactibacillus miurensis]SFS35022.1 N-acetylglucosamine transport system substrate-binding protein [Halolactibacillus miurensis]
MKLKHILLALMFMLLVGLVACGDSSEDTDTGGDTTGDDNTEEPSGDTEEPAEPETLHVAALESAYGVEVWENIIAAYEEAHGNVTVDLTIERNIEEVMRPNMQAGEYPDVFLLATDREEGLTETMIKENALASLDDMLAMNVFGEQVTVEDKLLDGFTDTLATNPYADDETYLAPMFYSPTGLFYNAQLLEEYGWEAPTTWDEMFELGEKALEEDIYLFTYSVAGYFDTLLRSMLYASGDVDLFNAAMTYEEGIWESEEASRVLETIAKLADYTHPDTVANANPNDFVRNQQLVLDNEAIFMPNGTWVVGEMAEAPRADGFEWGMMPVPAFEEGDTRYAFTFFEQIWVPSQAENVEGGKEFISFLYSDQAAEIFLAAGAAQPIEGIVNMMDDEQAFFYSIYSNDVLPAMGTFASTEPVPGVNIGDELYVKIDSVMSGRVTVEEWINSLESANDSLRPAMN